MAQEIDYYFSIGSPWAYFGLPRLRDLAARYGYRIVPRAVGIIAENGAVPARDKAPARQAYGGQDLRRWSAFLGKPLALENRPAEDPAPAARDVIAAALDGQDWLELALALHEAHWARGENIADPAVRRRIADATGLDGAALIERAARTDVSERLAADRARAVALGVFGAPTYVVDGTAYWGQDRLDFLEHHLRTGAPLA